MFELMNELRHAAVTQCSLRNIEHKIFISYTGICSHILYVRHGTTWCRYIWQSTCIRVGTAEARARAWVDPCGALGYIFHGFFGFHLSVSFYSGHPYLYITWWMNNMP
jgi:hypothetical protein